MRLEALVERLRHDEHLRRLLEETGNLPDDELLDSLIKEFEQVVERYKGLSTFAAKAKTLAAQTVEGNHAPAMEAVPPTSRRSPRERRKATPQPQAVDTLKIEPIKIGLPLLDLQEAERLQMAKRAEAERKAKVQNELAHIERMIQSEIERDWRNKSKGIQSEVARLEHARQRLHQELAAMDPQVEPSPPPVVRNDSPVVPEISDADLLYLHAVSSPRNAESSDIMDDLKAIDGAGPIMWRDHAGLRCYISTLRGDSVNATKAGVLLLNKQESLQWRARHEATLNRLRERGAIVAFQFGTVVRGLEEFAQRLEAAAVDLHIALDGEEHSKLWSVKVYALDESISTHLARLPGSTPVPDRVRESGRPHRRSDIKSLEKVLQQERRIAEVVHELLGSCASGATVQSMIGIGNGTSTDWKLVLEATYKVPPSGRTKFHAAVTRLQKEYSTHGVMFEVSGGAERFCFAPAAETGQSISA